MSRGPVGDTVQVINRARGSVLVERARWCRSFLCRLRGLTFRRRLGEGEGLILVERREGRSRTAIHMWAVFFPLGVLWINSRYVVVDARLARPWRMYQPAAPAQYVLEGNPAILSDITIGDQLDFVRA